MSVSVLTKTEVQMWLCVCRWSSAGGSGSGSTAGGGNRQDGEPELRGSGLSTTEHLLEHHWQPGIQWDWLSLKICKLQDAFASLFLYFGFLPVLCFLKLTKKVWLIVESVLKKIYYACDGKQCKKTSIENQQTNLQNEPRCLRIIIYNKKHA